MDESLLMTSGDYRKKIIYFALPIFLGNLFQQFYNTADSLIVGNFLGSSALAAVSSTGSLIFLLIGFFLGFSSGSGVIIAREIGARNDENTTLAVHTAVTLGIMFSVGMTVCGVFFAEPMLHMIGIPESVFPEASLYVRIYFAGSTGLVMYNIMVGILQAAGDSRHPLYYLIASSLINIVLDLLFIAVFHMGVEGAATATIISQFVSMFLVLHRLMHIDSAYRIIPSKIRIAPQFLREIFAYGLPTAMQGCVIDFANLMIQAYINSFGQNAMAGIGAYSRIEGFMFLPVTAFGMALTTFVSQNIGARQKDRAFRGIRFGTVCTLISIELIGIAIYVFAPQMISLFIQEPEVIYYGVLRARICSLFFFLLGFSHVTSSVMRGLGKPVVPMAVMLICWCAVRVIAIMLLGNTFHSIAFVSWLYPITWGLSSIAYIIQYMQIRRERALEA
ncbi:MAG: MATE family efflux transporter [Erysipelotrichaceae bacterium]|nr:MATE family efflux transporter [Erysipelotrichaceae bacterium]